MRLHAQSLSLGLLAVLGACRGQPHWPDGPAAACKPTAFPPGEIVVDVEVDGKPRRALAWVPRRDGPWDVAVVLHEYRSDPRRQLAYSGWVPHGPTEGILTVAPDGRSSTWNAGSCCGRAHTKRMDDVAFLDAVVAKLAASGCATDRVVATGIGNGGMMAEHWAWHSEVPRAVVSVGGALQVTDGGRSRPVPVLHYHGTADAFLPLDGSPGRLSAGESNRHTTPVGVSHQAWARRNGASGPPRTFGEGALACLERPGRAPTVLCLIDGAHDTWPGAADATLAIDHPLAEATAGGWSWAMDAMRAGEAD